MTWRKYGAARWVIEGPRARTFFGVDENFEN
jgi:hypothetical protein